MYKRQAKYGGITVSDLDAMNLKEKMDKAFKVFFDDKGISCLLYTSDAADERSSVDLGGRRIIKKKNKVYAFATSTE